jgi:methylenetetrahydrofolate dehydrogenase (NADP+)/methenyltetrahydrofolate cyclohydrolase
MAMMLSASGPFANATVTVCHSRTLTSRRNAASGFLISAVGKAGLVTKEMVKPGAVVIDVGMNRDANGKLCGDVDFEGVKDVASAMTPVPGGVAP